MAGVESRVVRTNGVRLHVLEAGEGPLVLLVHGFPGLSYSWRHQVPALAAAGWHAVAVDTRGYGGSDRPDGDYTAEVLEADLLGLLDAYGADQAVIVGQDFGSRYAWNLARHHPGRVRAVLGTVPFADQPSERPPTQVWRELAEKHFLHLHYFQTPGVAEADLGGENAREFLARLFWALSGEGTYFSVFGHGADTSYLAALEPAPPLPWSWLGEAEFDRFVAEFERGGDGREFIGGFGSYRAADADAAFEAGWRGQVIEQPAMLLIGEKDPVRTFTQVDRSLFADLTEVVVPGAGHHVQQERPAEFNAALLGFLAGLR